MNIKLKNYKFIIFITVLFFGVFGLAQNSQAAEYYASPNGLDSNCSDVSPCSLTTGIGKLFAGDTLLLKDGIYNQSAYVTTSGTSKAYITIKAQNDGQATIRVSGSGTPACYLYSVNYINLEGIICEGMGPSWGNTLLISDGNYINVKRVSTYYLNDEISSGITLSGGSHILIEDCVIKPSTIGSVINLYESSYTTVRRTAVIIDKTASSQRAISLYGADNCTIENNVVLNKHSECYIMGIGIWANTYNETANNNKFYGNVVHNMNTWAYIVASATNLITGNEFYNNVAIDSDRGFYQRADSNLTANNFTIVGATNQDFVQEQDALTKDPDWGMTGIVKDSSFITSGTGVTKAVTDPVGTTITSRYNNFYNVITQYLGTVLDKTGDATTNPSYDTATFGKGAYLMIPPALQGQGEGGADIGAEVLYRYVDGVLTGTPLWPWPMEERIKNETGYSVTYESGGGLWKTLDGVYADTTPPSAPTGLNVL
ncbi:MAG: NosD domain-containing protein [Patescibacteria group bacterium]